MMNTANLSSRDRMIEAAIDLLRGYGLSGSGINDIVRESAAPKGSVYHFFPDGKLQIAAEALAVYGGRVEAFIDAALAGRRSNPERVRALFEAFARRAEAGVFLRSCPVGTVGLDLAEGGEPLQPQLAAMLESWARVIEHHVQLGDTRSTRSFAGFVLTAVEGAYVRARAERSADAFREAGQWLAQCVR